MALALLALSRDGHGRPIIESVTFPTNSVPNTSAAPAVKLQAQLYMPARPGAPVSAVVITPSSGGVLASIELHYANALAEAGIAALVIDSFRSRGLADSISDQRLLNEFQTFNDAFGGFRWLAADRRFRADRIGIMGLSKGGGTALRAALHTVRRWGLISAAQEFAAHVPIAPFCQWLPRSARSTGAPVFFMLAELDDQTPPAPCLAFAERMRQAGATKVEAKIYKGAHHAWEVISPTPHFNPKAENYARCEVIEEDDGGMTSAKDGKLIPRGGWHEWARSTCMRLGTHCCGGNAGLKREATADLIAFFKRHGF